MFVESPLREVDVEDELGRTPDSTISNKRFDLQVGE